MSLSRETLELFAQLIGQVQLSAAAPDMLEQAQRVDQAKRELEAELAALLPESNPGPAS